MASACSGWVVIMGGRGCHMVSGRTSLVHVHRLNGAACVHLELALRIHCRRSTGWCSGRRRACLQELDPWVRYIRPTMGAQGSDLDYKLLFLLYFGAEAKLPNRERICRARPDPLLTSRSSSRNNDQSQKTDLARTLSIASLPVCTPPLLLRGDCPSHINACPCTPGRPT